MLKNLLLLIITIVLSVMLLGVLNTSVAAQGEIVLTTRIPGGITWPGNNTTLLTSWFQGAAPEGTSINALIEAGLTFPMYLAVDQEIMKVLAIETDYRGSRIITVERGVNKSAIGTHSSGSLVSWSQQAFTLDEVKEATARRVEAAAVKAEAARVEAETVAAKSVSKAKVDAKLEETRAAAVVKVKEKAKEARETTTRVIVGIVVIITILAVIGIATGSKIATEVEAEATVEEATAAEERERKQPPLSTSNTPQSLEPLTQLIGAFRPTWIKKPQPNLGRPGRLAGYEEGENYRLKKYLSSRGYRVETEVSLQGVTKRADLVVQSTSKRYLLECKVNFQDYDFKDIKDKLELYSPLGYEILIVIYGGARRSLLERLEEETTTPYDIVVLGEVRNT